MNNKDFLLIIILITIKGVTGNGGYKLGVEALNTKIKLRNTMMIRERLERENKIDCSGLLLGFCVESIPFIARCPGGS